MLEESDHIVGYILATLDAKSYYKKLEVAWMEEMKLKYPKPSKTTNLLPAEVRIYLLSCYVNFYIVLLLHYKVDETVCLLVTTEFARYVIESRGRHSTVFQAGVCGSDFESVELAN